MSEAPLKLAYRAPSMQVRAVRLHTDALGRNGAVEFRRRGRTLMVATVRSTVRAPENEHFVERYRGPVGAWVADHRAVR